MKANDFDQKLDGGNEGILADLDLAAIVKPNPSPKWVHVDFPVWKIESLDRDAKRTGVTPPSSILWWVAEKRKTTGGMTNRTEAK